MCVINTRIVSSRCTDIDSSHTIISTSVDTTFRENSNGQRFYQIGISVQ